MSRTMKPLGVQLARALSLLLSLILGWITLSFFVLVLIGFSSYHGVGLTDLLSPILFLILPGTLLTLLGFFLVIRLSNRLPYIWYFANIFWAAFFGFFIYLGLSWGLNAGYWQKTDYYLYSIPLVLCLGCIVVFHTPKIKDYFKVKRNVNPTPNGDKVTALINTAFLD